MKKKELKPLDYFKPFESTEPYVECTVNPDTGVYKIIMYGRIQNMKDYDFKNSSEIEIFKKFLINYISMKNLIRKERKRIQDYIMQHCKEWF